MANEITDTESNTEHQPALDKPTPAREQGQKILLKPILSWLHRTFLDVWFYVAAVSLIVNLVHTFRPQLSIQIRQQLPINQLQRYSRYQTLVPGRFVTSPQSVRFGLEAIGLYLRMSL
jgi:hypothetical protein